MCTPARNSRVECDRICGLAVADGEQKRHLPAIDRGLDLFGVSGQQRAAQPLGVSLVDDLQQPFGLQRSEEADLDLRGGLLGTDQGGDPLLRWTMSSTATVHRFARG